MKCRPYLPVLLVSCLLAGTWMSMFFPDPNAAAKRAAPRIDPRRDIVLCAADECAGESDRIAQICQDNHYVPGQGVPIFPVAGVMCQCPCLGSAP
ncbi:MAG TPA: hypothetical protein VFX30_09920 [bacterium]|nr:hypothetical protein [bacterium]